VLPLIKTTDSRAYVHTADPSVVADTGATEWIPVSQAESVGDDATVIHLRPLNAIEYFGARASLYGREREEYGAALQEIVRLAIARVEHYDGDIAADLPGPILDELAAVILAVSGSAT
jgi:hypothetical protein